jgi:hypothetical protein
MISSSVKSPTTHSLVLATLALVAAAAAFGSSAEARAGAAGGRQRPDVGQAHRTEHKVRPHPL